MPENITTTIDLIRHGEPLGGRKYRGQIDDPLSEKGWAQMRQAVGNLHPWQHIYSSSLSRCSEFAYELGRRHQLSVELDDRLREIGFGAWEGKTAEELNALDPGCVARFASDPIAHRPQGAETLQDFHSRVIGAWNEIIQRHEGEHLLLVGHAGMMRMIIREVLDMPLASMFRIHVANAAITRIQINTRHHHRIAKLLFHDGKLSQATPAN